jgi:hypothetical protein
MSFDRLKNARFAKIKNTFFQSGWIRQSYRA